MSFICVARDQYCLVPLNTIRFQMESLYNFHFCVHQLQIHSLLRSWEAKQYLTLCSQQKCYLNKSFHYRLNLHSLQKRISHQQNPCALLMFHLLFVQSVECLDHVSLVLRTTSFCILYLPLSLSQVFHLWFHRIFLKAYSFPVSHIETMKDKS